MKAKICPFCERKTTIKALLDPYKETEQKDRYKLYGYACGTKKCYLQYGNGDYVEKENRQLLEDSWKNIPYYNKKIPKVGEDGYYTHYTPSGGKDKIVCSQRKAAKYWSDNKDTVNCVRCFKAKIFKGIK